MSGPRAEPVSLLCVPGDPYSVFVIKEGYAYTDEEGKERADGTITLIKGPRAVLVDTGNPRDGGAILRALDSNGLKASDVSLVVCTHGHSDHVGNLSLFPDATFVVSCDISHGDTYLSHGLQDGLPYRVDDWLEVIGTPGHCAGDVSLVVRGTREGTVVVVGDLFEREDDDDSWRALSENPDLQARSRERVRSLADVIIPGHGSPFRVLKEGALNP